MAFFKGGRKKKKSKEMMMGMLIMGMMAIAIITLLYVYHTKVVNRYETKVTELERVFKEETQKVVRVKDVIKAGQKFDAEKIELVDAPGFIVPENAIVNFDELEDQIAKLDIEANTAVLKTMVVDESIPSNAREVELNMLLLPSNLNTNNYMDIRINFPTGEDYVVVSKKKVRDLFLKENTVWLWLSEREILELSSAIIDGYLREGSKLYCVTYVDPMFQEKSIPNYPENLYVLDLIKKDPNIIDRATEQMASEIRILLENNLNMIDKEDGNKLKGNIVNEITKRGTQVQEKIKNESEEVDQTGQNSEVFN